MTGRQLSTLVAGSFLAGVGATAIASYVQLQRENHKVDGEVDDLEARLSAEKSWTEAARHEAREGRNHVEALLRTPTVSETDRLTDISAAREWLKKQKEVD